MLKGQDVVILIKLLAVHNANWSQRDLAQMLCMSQSELNAALKRLKLAGLLVKNSNSGIMRPVLAAAKEYLVYGVKYSFPASLGEYTPGILTGIAAPVFDGKFVLGDDPLPVWPYSKGTLRGVALKPLYSSVPQSVIEFPDQKFYDLLALVDAIRQGRARELNMAVKMLEGLLRDE